MKKLNKKGFTLIELLAVIVILAILVAVAIPAVTRYLDTARKGAYSDNVQAAVNAVRTDVTSQFGSVKSGIYPLESTCYTETIKTGVLAKNNKSKADCTAATSTTKDVWLIGINDLLEKKLNTSSYGATYKTDISYIQVVRDTRADSNTKGSYYYYVCIVDNAGYGIEGWADQINESSVAEKTTCSKAIGKVAITDRN